MPTREELAIQQKAYKGFLEQTEGLRPVLYRYCRYLSRSAWDAEDLLQESLLHAYAKLGWTYQAINDWRAYLFRTATHLWINEQRRSGRMQSTADLTAIPEQPKSALLADEFREALTVMLEQLSPQERVALVLREVFDLPLGETAAHLRTSAGAVKDALYRARAKLAAARSLEPGPARSPSPPPGVLEKFVTAFNAHNVDAIVELLREDASAEVVGMVQEHDREQIRKGSLPHTVVEDDFAMLRWHASEWLVFLGRRKEGSDEVQAASTILRFDLAGEQIVNLRYYYFTLDLLGEVCGAAGIQTALCGVYFYA